jgi:hypothetical protein
MADWAHLDRRNIRAGINQWQCWGKGNIAISKPEILRNVQKG